MRSIRFPLNPSGPKGLIVEVAGRSPGGLRLFVTRRSVARAQQGRPDRGRAQGDRGIPQPRRGEDMPRKPLAPDRRPARRPGRDRSGGGRASGAGAMVRDDPRRAAFGARHARRIPEGGARRRPPVPVCGSVPCPRPSSVRAETRAPARPCPARVGGGSGGDGGARKAARPPGQGGRGCGARGGEADQGAQRRRTGGGAVALTVLRRRPVVPCLAVVPQPFIATPNRC